MHQCENYYLNGVFIGSFVYSKSPNLGAMDYELETTDTVLYIRNKKDDKENEDWIHEEFAEEASKFTRCYDEQWRSEIFNNCQFYIKEMSPGYKCPEGQAFCHCKFLLHYCCYFGKRLLLLQALDIFDEEWLVASLEQKVKIHGKILTPLSAAVQGGQIDCVTSLLAHHPASLKLDFDAADLLDAANLAVDCGRLSALNVVLESICDRKSAGFRQLLKSTLGKSVDKGFDSAAHLLINHGADITAVMQSKHTSDAAKRFVMEQAVKYGNPSLRCLVNAVITLEDVRCLKYLLQGPYFFVFDLNHLVDGQTPLTAAVKKQNLEIVTELLTYDVDTNKSNKWNETPLFLAIKIFSQEERDSIAINAYSMALAIIRYGCDVNQAILTETSTFQWPDCPADKPFLWSHQNEIAHILKILLISGAQVQTIKKLMSTKMSSFKFRGRKELEKKVIDMCNQPRSLLSLSRLSIRNKLVTNIPKKVAGLYEHLPSTLVEYLLLPELTDDNMYPNLYIHRDNKNAEDNSDDDDDDDDDDNDDDDNWNEFGYGSDDDDISDSSDDDFDDFRIGLRQLVLNQINGL